VRPAASWGDDDFSLGKGQAIRPAQKARIPREAINARVFPALLEVIAAGGDVRLARETLTATAKASGEGDQCGVRVSLHHHLEKNDQIEMKRAAALCLGVLGRDEAISLTLVPLLRDGEAGRALVGGAEPVDPGLRGFAAYGMALVGASTDSVRTRREAVRALAEVIDDREADDELRAAAILALGFVPLPIEGPPELEPGAVDFDLSGQIAFVLARYLDGGEATVVRSHAASTLGRLVASERYRLPFEVTQPVMDVLISTLEPERRQPHPVKESAILGLGLMGHAGNEMAKDWVHYTLRKAFWTGGPLERRYSLIAMGQVAARPGVNSEEPYQATKPLRGILLHHMTKGRRDLRSWSAMGLGLLGYGLRQRGIEPDPEIDLAIRTAIVNNWKSDDLGAYAIAAGLRGDMEAVEPLLDRLRRARDPGAKAHVAVALGMLRDPRAIEPLREVLTGKRVHPGLLAEAGLALGLIGDASEAPALIERLGTSEDPALRSALATALGALGDEASIRALTELLCDDSADPEVRTAAVIALGRLCDEAQVPWRTRLIRGTNYHACPETLTNPGRTGAVDLH